MPEYHTGNLDHRIDVLRAVRTLGTYNEPVETFTTYATLSAGRTDASAAEGYRAAEVGGQITARFVVRYSPEAATITNKDRIRLEDGLTYDIVAVREVKRNQWLEIDAVARTDR